MDILWHDPEEIPVLCPTARRRLETEGRQLKRCEACLRQRWKRALTASNRGGRFVGKCGAANFCACLQVEEGRPLTIVSQAKPASVSSSGRGARGASKRRIRRAAVEDAMRLARLILHDLERTAWARMAEMRLDEALCALDETQNELARLRGDGRADLGGAREEGSQPFPGNRARNVVEAMRAFARAHYHRPVCLGEVALAMKMNASYLSALFSQTTGMTFHHFLEDIRLSKAKALLLDVQNRVGEVAYATGYASPDAFRHAFKAHEGVSPEAWRAGQ